MAKTTIVPLKSGTGIAGVTNAAAEALRAQGFECTPIILNDTLANLNVKIDRDGIKNIIGLGLESKVTLTLMNDSLNVSVEDEWSNKIIAIALGWFVCLVPFITGIVGCVNQSGLSKKIFDAIQLAAASQQDNPTPPTA